jgi:hypothetical protein
MYIWKMKKKNPDLPQHSGHLLYMKNEEFNLITGISICSRSNEERKEVRKWWGLAAKEK